MTAARPLPFLPYLDPKGWTAAIINRPLKPIPGHKLRAGIAANRQANIGLPLTLGRIGSLEVRLARSSNEVKRAQKLRYRVFYGEMAAIPDMRSRLSRRDRDAYDPICDHLIVIDHNAPPTRTGKPRIVGTYRLLRQEVAERHDGFYTASEYDIAPLIGRHPEKRFLELGRSCVLEPYRNKRTVELLWHGIWTYVLHHRIDVMFGCASLPGTSVERVAPALSALAGMAPADTLWSARAVSARHVPLARASDSPVDTRAALASLPPLLKGYLRIGAMIGDGAVIDHQFGTTDVLIVLPVERINPRYIGHFGAEAERYAA